MRRFIVVLLLAGMCPAGAQAATPRDARALVDSAGVNTHLSWTDTPYGNYTMVKQRLRELGVRHIRDGFDPDRRQAIYDRINDLAANGVRSTLFACYLTSDTKFVLDAYISDAKNKVRSALDAVAGANEPDLMGYSDWSRMARSCQYWLHRYAKDGTFGAPLSQPVIGPALGLGPQAHTVLGDVTASTDAGAIHCYPGAQRPSLGNYGRTLAGCLADARRNVGSEKPIHVTETGYHDALGCVCGHHPTPQRVQAIYVPRLFFEYARLGVARAFLYELVDPRPAAGPDPERNFGLFENDWSYKPAGLALKNLTTLVDSPSASARAALDYTLTNTGDPDGTGPRGAIRDMLLQKADGSWWLALWQDSSVWNRDTSTEINNPTTLVGVTVDRTVSVTGYRPTYGTGNVGSLTGVRSFRAGVGDDVLLIRITQ